MAVFRNLPSVERTAYGFTGGTSGREHDIVAADGRPFSGIYLVDIGWFCVVLMVHIKKLLKR